MITIKIVYGRGVNMKKKGIVIVLSALLALLVCLFTFNDTSNINKDSYKFKKEYESLNGKTREKDGKKIRKVHINIDNPIKYSSAKEIIEKMDNKDTFVVYFGFSDCPWCRSVVENLISVAKDKNVGTIYYVDVKNIRDEKALSNGEIITKKDGTKSYMKLIEKLDNVLNDYNLIDDDNKEVPTGEKRIYAPNIVAVVNGKPEELTDGISSKQEDPYMELSNKIKKESKKKIECIFKCLEKSNVCTAKTTC